ncbi:MAG: aminotransferase class I/II-fold pyridoxal phosphate-dependent enzyme, partial [Clostridiales bacterium]|nr:aminotransferase class I/II-fold pyridoxal phosphate-dependent enzyme [Clostridiales bacterium]
DCILCGNGAADLIYRLCDVLAPERGLVCAPTFSEYERSLERFGCTVERHQLNEQNGFAMTPEIEGSISEATDVLFLCNPNNPTGRLISHSVLAGALNRARQTGAAVVVDECFLDFTDGISCKGYLESMPNLVIIKAFTKLYAMAGLRLGYLLCSDSELLEKLRAAAPFWSVSVPAQIAGVAALSCGGWIEKTRELVSGERAYMSKSLSELGLNVFPSDVNYILLRCNLPLYEPLLQKGVLIRSCANFYGLNETYYRVAVKTREENNRLIQAVREIVNC